MNVARLFADASEGGDQNMKRDLAACKTLGNFPGSQTDSRGGRLFSEKADPLFLPACGMLSFGRLKALNGLPKISK